MLCQLNGIYTGKGKTLGRQIYLQDGCKNFPVFPCSLIRINMWYFIKLLGYFKEWVTYKVWSFPVSWLQVGKILWISWWFTKAGSLTVPVCNYGSFLKIPLKQFGVCDQSLKKKKTNSWEWLLQRFIWSRNKCIDLSMESTRAFPPPPQGHF